MVEPWCLPMLAVPVVCGCAARTPAPAAPTPAAQVHLRGVVTYEARHPTPRGLSLDLETRPARWVEVEARDPGGTVLGHTLTDADGRFTLLAPPAARELVAIAHAHWNGHDVAVSPDAAGRTFHEVHVQVGPGAQDVTLAARDEAPGSPAGAFHITDTMLRGVEAARAWTGSTLPPLWAWWGRGITDRWSYYHGERPVHSGRFAIELMGGTRGREASSDTDDHDEAIVLHEVGHFVFDQLSTSSSIGGMHPGTSLIDPGLAWEEGRATWFGAAVRGSPMYQDSVGHEPDGSLRVDRNVEHAPDGPMGNGSEASVSHVLWELADGADGLVDTDHDGIALGPAAVLRAMVAQRSVEGAYPCLQDFARFLTGSGAVTADALAAMLHAVDEPASILAEAPAWPTDIPTLPASVTGKVDGRTDPAPSGGRARPLNGFDAERVYRIHVTERSRVSARLTIDGSGTTADHTDLDLELRSLRSDLVAGSTGSFAVQTVSHAVDPGYYILYVRDAGTGGGNKAGFRLDVRVTSLR